MTDKRTVDEEEEYTFPPVDLSCHLCRRHPCECEELLRKVRENSEHLAQQADEDYTTEDFGSWAHGGGSDGA